MNMKKNNQLILLAAMLMLVLSSCSINRFSTKKNHHPRVRLEASHDLQFIETVNNDLVAIPSYVTPTMKPLKSNPSKVTKKVKKSGESFSEKVIKTFFPEKTQIFKPIFERKKNPLKKGQETKMDGDQVTGLVINLLALVIAITSIFMVFGLSVNVWVYFLIGLILAICALIIGFVGKHLPWKGFAIAAIAVAILAIILLIVLMVAVTVFSLIW